MRIHARHYLIAAIGLLPVAALAAGSGTCTYKDKKNTFTDAIVFQKPDPFEKGKKETTIALSTEKIDVAKFKASDDADMALLSMDGGKIQLTLGDGGVTMLYAYFPPGSNISNSGGPYGDLKLSRNDASGMAGTFTLKGKEADDVSCDVKFDAPLIAHK